MSAPGPLSGGSRGRQTLEQERERPACGRGARGCSLRSVDRALDHQHDQEDVVDGQVAANGSRGLGRAQRLLEQLAETPAARLKRRPQAGILSRKLAAAYHYPAIDVLTSLSRTMPRVVQPAQMRAAGQLRKYLAKHQDIELLLQLGEYKKGSDPDADIAIAKIEPIRKLLQQSSDDIADFGQSVSALQRLF